MLSLFRRFAASPIGIGLFGLILVAFVVTLYEGRSGLSGLVGADGDTIVTVGGDAINATEIKKRALNQLEGERQSNPALDMPGFLAAGGLDRTVDVSATARAVEQFAKAQGMVVSRRAVDGEIASNPAFAGPTGKFDPVVFRDLLARRRLSEVDVRSDLGRDMLIRSLLVPSAGAARVPAGIVEPYSALLLESRTGAVAIIPARLFAPTAAPADAEIVDFYRRGVARYTLPERRVIRYTAFDASRFASQSQPTETEVQKAYTDNAALYGGREKRSFTQVIVPRADQANALLAQVKAGQTLAAAAGAVKREPIAVPSTDEAAFAKLTAANVARAAFAAPKGGYASVERSGLGYHVVRVDGVTAIAATPLATVRAKLAGDLAAAKEKRAVADFVGQIEDAIAAKATLDEVASKNNLTLLTTAPVTANGRALDTPGYVLPPEAVATLKDAFQAEVDDQPAVATVGEGKAYVVWKLDRKLAAAPLPLAQVRPQVIADIQLAKGAARAKQAAEAVAAAVNAGTPLAQALGKTGVALPAPQPAAARRIDLQQAKEPARAPLALMFSMPERRARVLASADGTGQMIVYLDHIARGDPRTQPGLIQATQQQLGRVFGDEYFQQFATAIRAQVGVKKNAAAIAALKRGLIDGSVR